MAGQASPGCVTGALLIAPASRWSRREALIGALSLGTAAGSMALRPARKFKVLGSADIDTAIPHRLGDYRMVTGEGVFVPPGDELSRQLYDQVLMRMYARPGGPRIMTLLAYASVQNLTVELHRPEKCYPEQGFSVTPLVTVPVVPGDRRIKAAMLSAVRDGYHEQILYWTRVGNEYPTSAVAEKIVVARADLTGSMPDGILVRLSMATADRDAAMAQMLDFAGSLIAGLPPRGRQLVLAT